MAFLQSHQIRALYLLFSAISAKTEIPEEISIEGINILRYISPEIPLNPKHLNIGDFSPKTGNTLDSLTAIGVALHVIFSTVNLRKMPMVKFNPTEGNFRDYVEKGQLRVFTYIRKLTVFLPMQFSSLFNFLKCFFLFNFSFLCNFQIHQQNFEQNFTHNKLYFILKIPQMADYYTRNFPPKTCATDILNIPTKYVPSPSPLPTVTTPNSALRNYVMLSAKNYPRFYPKQNL
jgi:hypothetical protein